MNLSLELDKINTQLDDLYKARKRKQISEDQFLDVETNLLNRKEEIKSKMWEDLSK